MHGRFRGVSCAAITVLAGALLVAVPVVAGADELGSITGTVSTEGSVAAAAAAEVTIYDGNDALVRSVVASETVTLGDAQLTVVPRSPAPVITGPPTVGS